MEDAQRGVQRCMVACVGVHKEMHRGLCGVQRSTQRCPERCREGCRGAWLSVYGCAEVTIGGS